MQERNPNTLVGDIEMHAALGQNDPVTDTIVESIETATDNGLTVVLYCIRETDVPMRIRRNPRVTVAEVQMEEVRLP